MKVQIKNKINVQIPPGSLLWLPRFFAQDWLATDCKQLPYQSASLDRLKLFVSVSPYMRGMLKSCFFILLNAHTKGIPLPGFLLYL